MSAEDRTIYRERLLPRLWVWLVLAALVGTVAVAYGAAFGATAGWIVWLVGFGIAALILWVTAPAITVTDRALVVGPACLPRSSIGAVEAVDSVRIRDLRGPGADARTFAAVRPWSCPDGVLVSLDDPDDPHPAWLVSSRHPDRLAGSLTATMSPTPEEDA